MVLPTVLKRKHSLRGKQILPVVRKLKESQDAQSIKQLARVSSARRTESMPFDDIMVAVKDLTGENGVELLELAGNLACNFCDILVLIWYFIHFIVKHLTTVQIHGK